VKHHRRNFGEKAFLRGRVYPPVCLTLQKRTQALMELLTAAIPPSFTPLKVTSTPVALTAYDGGVVRLSMPAQD